MKILVSFAFFCMLCQVEEAVGIACTKCHSSVSWDDCSKRQIAVNCSSIFNRCFSFYRIKTLQSGRQQHEYQKGCYHDGSCNLLDCMNKMSRNHSRCNMECCNATLCNKNILQSSNEILKRQQEREDNKVKNKFLNNKGEEKKGKKPFKCYVCSSPFSWENCHRNQTIMVCPEPLNVCTTYHRVLTLPSGNQEHQYKKGCWHNEYCSNEQCRETDNDVKGSWCDMRCCNSARCNYGGIKIETGSIAMQVMNSASIAQVHLFALAHFGAFIGLVSIFL